MQLDAPTEYLNGAANEIFIVPAPLVVGSTISTKKSRFSSETFALPLLKNEIGYSNDVLLFAATSFCLHLFSGVDDFLVSLTTSTNVKIPLRCSFNQNIHEISVGTFLQNTSSSLIKSTTLFRGEVVPGTQSQV